MVLAPPEIHPAQGVEKRAAFRLELESALHQSLRLVEIAALLGKRITDEIHRRGVLRVDLEQKPHLGNRLLEFARALVGRTERIEQALILGRLRQRLRQQPDGLSGATVSVIQLGQRADQLRAGVSLNGAGEYVFRLALLAASFQG